MAASAGKLLAWGLTATASSLTAFLFLNIQIETKGKCAMQQQGAWLEIAQQTIQELDILARKEMTMQLFEIWSN